ncbi:type II toxin-antitoxin system ParD family antitoxin [Algoriphagus yeomjeoni]|uniref:type II toxin-antitoxin system ParD family antitoxin n=1 Tax=Algoriphagus yeomjeoni TaxID=291403 RepID=UPI001FEC3212|nr:type II toxin-antitoxin system ParD family antitoxin [Algoriphagus yeomjeoni]
MESNRVPINKNTSILLGSFLDEVVQNRINGGRFNNISEVIRAGLRLLEEAENKVIVLSNAIQEGIESGSEEDFDPKNI